MKDTSFALAVLSYNHPEITRRAISSCLKTGRPTYLLHNGSRRDWIEKLEKEFPSVRHLVLTENRGFAGGASHLISAALKEHEWVLFLSNDCELTDSRLIPPRKSGLYAPVILRRKTGEIESLGGYLDLRRFRLHHCRNEAKYSSVKGDLPTYIPGAAFWVDRDSWKKLGSFNRGLSSYWEDVELSLRAAQLGIELGLDPITRIEHGIGKTCHKDPYYTSYLFQRNRIWMARALLPTHKRAWFYGKILTEFALRSGRQIRNRDRLRLSLSTRALRDGLLSKNPIEL